MLNKIISINLILTCSRILGLDTNNCPAGIATQKPELRKLINIDKSATQLYNFFNASTELMKVMARACGHNHLNKFNSNDTTTWKKDMAELTGIKFGGVK